MDEHFNEKIYSTCHFYFSSFLSARLYLHFSHSIAWIYVFHCRPFFLNRPQCVSVDSVFFCTFNTISKHFLLLLLLLQFHFHTSTRWSMAFVCAKKKAKWWKEAQSIFVAYSLAAHIHTMLGTFFTSSSWLNVFCRWLLVLCMCVMHFPSSICFCLLSSRTCAIFYAVWSCFSFFLRFLKFFYYEFFYEFECIGALVSLCTLIEAIHIYAFERSMT